MNSFLRSLAILTAGSLLSGGLVQASSNYPNGSYPNGSNNNPDNSAIRRANPNSRQGTESISPRLRGPDLSPGPSRTPTLENGGIGNRYPNRQDSSPRPSSNAPSTR